MDKYISIAFADMVANLLQDELCSRFDSALLHGFMGISSESAELLVEHMDTTYIPNEIRILVELSDLLHFTQMLVNKLDLSLIDVVALEKRTVWKERSSDVLHTGLNLLSLQYLAGLAGAAGELLNRYKKFIYYHGEPFTKEEILEGLAKVLHYLLLVAHLYGSSLNEIMVINIAKLGARYPDGYSHDKAITHKRDKEKERDAIEVALENYRRSQQ